MKDIIFDFDGTIADSFNVVLDVTQQLTGRPALKNKNMVAKLRSESLIKVAKQLNIPKCQWPILIIRGRRLMTTELSKLKPFSGMAEVLETLHQKGFRLYIISTNSNLNITSFLKTHQLEQYFEKIYGGVRLNRKSDALRKILELNELSSNEVIYIGDEVRDVVAAKRAHVPVVAVSWGFNNANRLKKEKPTVLVHNRAELLKALSNIVS